MQFSNNLSLKSSHFVSFFFKPILLNAIRTDFLQNYSKNFRFISQSLIFEPIKLLPYAKSNY